MVCTYTYLHENQYVTYLIHEFSLRASCYWIPNLSAAQTLCRLRLERRIYFCGYLGVDQPSSRRIARSFVSMHEKIVFDTMHEKLIGSLKLKKWILWLAHQYGEATKISILSNDQTCHLCKVGSIVYSISCTPEATDLNQGCAAMRSNLVKISSQTRSEKLKISLSKFNFLKWYVLQYINYVKSPVVVACQLSRILTWFQSFSISLLSLGAVLWLRSGTDLITCESVGKSGGIQNALSYLESHG